MKIKQIYTHVRHIFNYCKTCEELRGQISPKSDEDFIQSMMRYTQQRCIIVPKEKQ